MKRVFDRILSRDQAAKGSEVTVSYKNGFGPQVKISLDVAGREALANVFDRSILKGQQLDIDPRVKISFKNEP